MISEGELRRRLDQLKSELDLALSRVEGDLQEILQRAETIVEEIRVSIEPEVEPKKTHSILEWEGVGQEFWSKIDVDEYIRKERDSWR